ncbi:hypothetical protein [Veillonella magna]|uniref:Uncharacterized protein n=1 Tax=Veillonella magna TaxID=464322 RepID=A0ABS2GIZ3_9FIRM|nr:hypothetical protein [Veillonella magna]MBM6824803.1 hypothetical protein [Veillonella magna]MBM6913118.1 hypothetical protein [Veillonella magna]
MEMLLKIIGLMSIMAGVVYIGWRIYRTISNSIEEKDQMWQNYWMLSQRVRNLEEMFEASRKESLLGKLRNLKEESHQ